MTAKESKNGKSFGKRITDVGLSIWFVVQILPRNHRQTFLEVDDRRGSVAHGDQIVLAEPPRVARFAASLFKFARIDRTPLVTEKKTLPALRRAALIRSALESPDPGASNGGSNFKIRHSGADIATFEVAGWTRISKICQPV